ncbi:DUF5906 domain-containing protein [Rhizobium nepotum]|uniref:DUF5906 domain-containing protein n=1 Tax=Rhizobium nepotum TaxID=1035271 RepID=UPI003CF88AB3
MLEHIEHLARAGFAIHWLHPKSKAPIGNDWSSKPVRTLDQLRNSYKSGNNVGVRLGKWSKVGSEYLLVIDVDIRNADLAKQAFAKLKELFPSYETYPSVISGSGGASRHFYILTSKAFPSKQLAHAEKQITVWDEKQKKDVKKWEWEIELFGTGKQVAMPPSIHPTTEKPYVWERPFDIDDVDLGIGPSIDHSYIAKLIDYDEERENAPVDPESIEPLGLTPEEVGEMLAKIPNEDVDYDEWLNIMASVQHELQGHPLSIRKQFYEVFRAWSAASPKHDDDTTRDKFRSFKNSPNRKQRTMRSVVSLVREIDLDEEMEDLGEFDDLGPEDGDTDGEFDDILGGDKPSKREIRLRKAEVEKELGHVPKRIQRLNKKHAVTFLSGKCVIITENKDGTTSYGTPGELHNWYENDRVATEKSTQPVSKSWMQHKSRREYPDGVVFAPGKDKEGYFNHWKGFDVEPDASGSCKMWLSHLREIICNGNEDHYRYALGWFAHMVQKPWEKPGVAMVLRGRKRIGKDTIADYFGGLIKRYHVTVANQDQMVGKFNAHQERCLMLHVQEGFWAGNKQAEGSLKYLITSTSVLIEPKSVNAFTVDSYLRLFISSNEDWVVPATADEGRYFVLDVSDKRKDDHLYFGAMKREMMNGGLEALLDYLQKYDISKFEVRKVPDTAALADQKTKGLKNFEAYLFNILQSGEFPVEFSTTIGHADWQHRHIRFDRSEFYEDYLNWMKRRRFDGETVSQIHMGKELVKIFGDEVKSIRLRIEGARPWGYMLPNLPTCREFFEKHMMSKIDWGDEMRMIEEDELDEFDNLDDI